jgi:hypothetical protein
MVAGLGLALTAGVMTPASALLVQPINILMTSTGPQSNAAITVVNDRDRPNTFEVTVNKLTLPENGQPVVTPIKGDDFLVFPPTATVQPGQTQVVRIRWVGDPILKESQAYMFNTAELPVNQLKGSGVQVVYSIQSLVTVTSPTLKPNITISAGTLDTENQPATSDHPARTVPGIGVTVSNTGNGLDFLTNYKFTMKSGAWSMIIDPHDIAQYVGLGLVMPNSKRHFFMVLPNLPATAPVEISLEREPGR